MQAAVDRRTPAHCASTALSGGHRLVLIQAHVVVASESVITDKVSVLSPESGVPHAGIIVLAAATPRDVAVAIVRPLSEVTFTFDFATLGALTTLSTWH